MLGELITRILVLVLGYAYPAFECFKAVEKNRVDVEDLRYWCQYWILVAVVTVLERVCDIFIAWLPMYGEMKLAFFIYLWYPKTKGSGRVYDSLLKPYLINHETDIERNMHHLREKSWEFLVYYMENFTQIGQSTFFYVLDYAAANVGMLRQPGLQRNESREGPPRPPPTAPSAPPSPSPSGMFRRNRPSSDGNRPPQSPFSTHRSAAEPGVSDTFQVHLHDKTHFVRAEDLSDSEMDYWSDSDSGKNPKLAPEEKQHNLPYLSRLKLRLSKGIN